MTDRYYWLSFGLLMSITFGLSFMVTAFGVPG